MSFDLGDLWPPKLRPNREYGKEREAKQKQTVLVGFYLQMTQLATWRSSVQDLPHFTSARSTLKTCTAAKSAGKLASPTSFLAQDCRICYALD